MKQIKIILILVANFLVSYILFASDFPEKIEINERLKTGEKLSIVLKLSKINIVYSEDTDWWGYWWGAKILSPEFTIASIKIVLNDRECRRIPTYFFSILDNVNNAKVDVLNSGFKMIVDGGDGSTNYTAYFYFDNQCSIISRKIFNQAFPDEVWEEFIYAYHPCCPSLAQRIEFSDRLETGEKLSVVLNFSKPDKSFPYKNPSWWGADESFWPAESLISSIKVVLNNSECWLRFSSYSDLADVNRAKLEVSDNEFTVTIRGGETSTSYVANLYFDAHLNSELNCSIASRKVYSPLFPDEVWEETIYSYISRTDM